MSFAAIVLFICWLLAFGGMAYKALTTPCHDPVAKPWTPPVPVKPTKFERPSAEQLQLLLINVAVEETIRTVS